MTACQPGSSSTYSRSWMTSASTIASIESASRRRPSKVRMRMSASWRTTSISSRSFDPK
jgi:hypothetical protein